MRTKQFGKGAPAPSSGKSDNSKSGNCGPGPVQLDFKNHCIFCLRRQTPEQLCEIVKVNPKNLANFQPIISYLTGTDPTKGRREEECKEWNLPKMGNLPPMCAYCYNVTGEIYRLHMDLQNMQQLIQEETLKMRRIVGDNEKVAMFKKTVTNQDNFYTSLKEDGMPEQQFEAVRKFVNHLHFMITRKGESWVKFPTLPDSFRNRPLLAKTSSTASDADVRYQPNFISPLLSEAASVVGFRPISPSAHTSAIRVKLGGNPLQPSVSNFRIKENMRTSKQSSFSSGSCSKSLDSEELIDLCSDDEEEVKSLDELAKENEDEINSIEEIVKKDEDYEDDNSDHPVTDPLFSPESVYEEEEQEASVSEEEIEVINDGKGSSWKKNTVNDFRESQNKEAITKDSLLEAESESSPITTQNQPQTVFSLSSSFPTWSLPAGGTLPIQVLPIITASIPFLGPISLSHVATSEHGDCDNLSTAATESLKPKKKTARKARVRKRKPKPKKQIVARVSASIQNCEICNGAFHRQDLKAHMRSHLGRDGLSCTGCNKTYATKRSFYFHDTAKKKQGRCESERKKLAEFYSSTCIICNENIPVKMESFRLREFYVHLFAKHETDSSLERTHECKMCDLKFRTEYGLDFHMNEHLSKIKKHSLGALTSISDLRIGIPQTRFHYDTEAIRDALIKDSNHTNIAAVSDCQHVCEICERNFKNAELLAEHSLTPHKPKQCKHCSLSFTHHEHYIKHLKSHKDLTKPCDICWKEEKDVSFKFLHTLQTHYFSVHEIGKEEVCNICNQKYFCRTNLLTHFNKVHVRDAKKDADKDNQVINYNNVKMWNRNIDLMTEPDSSEESPVIPQFMCKICEKNFDTEEMWEEHSKIPHKEIQCKLCEFTCTRHLAYLQHLKFHKEKVCDICWSEEQIEKKCRGIPRLESHYYHSHEVGEIHACQKCTKVYFREHSLKLHTTSLHLSKLTTASNSNQVAKDVFHCDICMKNFESREILEEHQKTPHHQRQCRYCEFNCIEHLDYLKHLHSHEDSHKPCDICWNDEKKYVNFENVRRLQGHFFYAHGMGKADTGNVFKEKVIWKITLPDNNEKRVSRRKGRRRLGIGRIQNKAVTNKPGKRSPNLQSRREAKRRREPLLGKYRCMECPSRFQARVQLHEHEVQKHPELQLPLECQQCWRTFLGHHRLKAHMDRHLNPTFYSCSICPKKFRSAAAAHRHRYTHGERSFICEHCGRGFKQSVTLKAHMLTHLPGGRPKPNICEFCGKSYGDKIYLRRHIAAHHSSNANS